MRSSAALRPRDKAGVSAVAPCERLAVEGSFESVFPLMFDRLAGCGGVCRSVTVGPLARVYVVACRKPLSVSNGSDSA